MTSIALIGPDGAGKTTITRMLESSSLLPFKYLYMGINLEASNVALPTSRLIEYLKQSRNRRSGVSRPRGKSVHDRSNPKRKPMGKLWALARLVNRLADEWYRQLISWSYQLQGYLVLYDRHFLFDFAIDSIDNENQSLSKRVHRWCLTHFYPRPDLVIYLDAPAEVLFARKGEWTPQYLEHRRQAFIQQGKQTPNFVQIDVSQPLDIVHAEVLGHIMRFYRNRKARTARLDRNSVTR